MLKYPVIRVLYRLSRARRCSENAFGVMTARFQIFRSPMRYDPDDACTIILTAYCLHNMLRSQSMGRAMYTPPSLLDEEDEISGEFHPGEWRAKNTEGMVNFVHQGGKTVMQMKQSHLETDGVIILTLLMQFLGKSEWCSKLIILKTINVCMY